MICVYPADCTDFSNNGMGTVSPSSCTVTETLNGEWELTLVHPLDAHDKWRKLTDGNILRVPVPAAMTPQINLVTQQYQTTTYDVEIYKVSTNKDPLRLRSGTGTKYKILGKYKKGTEVIVIEKTSSSWYEVTCPDGKHGYMSSEYLTYVRTEQQSTSTHVGFQNDVVEARQLRDQPFRIYRVVPELDKITVYARHIFYDLLDNMIKSVKPASDAVGASVVRSISDGCLSEHDFTFYSDLESTAADVSFENINPVEALLGDDGLTGKYGAELARDWFDVFLVSRVGTDSQVQIREKKNLTGITIDVDMTDTVTRIMPTGEDADGNVLYLPELYLDGPNIDYFPHPKWIHLPVSEAKEVTEGDDTKSKSECYAEMRKAAQAEFDAGCDAATASLKVDFVNCKDTEEYKQFAALTDIFLGDSVKVVLKRMGFEVVMRMTQYTYDCLTRKYTSVTLGTASETLEGTTVSARQLASGSISGTKLMLNSIGSGHLQNGSVGSLQVKAAAIQSAHIQTAAITQAHIANALIETLNANAITAVSAKIQELAAGQITTDELYASIAMISVAQLTTANILNANIEWAQIESLAAEIATISKAQITAANIDEANINWAAITTLTASVASIVKAEMGTADIDWAHIKDLATDTAIITQGTAGELYIARLAVTEANMVSLTVGELVVKGSDGHFYSISVDENGEVVTTLKQVSNDDVADLSINGGEKIIEGSITAGTLNVQNIFADNATIRSLIAANIDVDTLFAREATINAINAMDITSNTYLKLMVAEKADQSDVDALGERMDAAELKITPDAIVSTVTGSQKYKDDLASVSVSGSGPEFIVGTQTATTGAWTGVAGFSELKDGQQITYWLPQGGSGNATLELTFPDGSTTGAIPCYYSQATRLSTQYVAGNILHLTYRENAKYNAATISQGWWADANYNTDTYDRIRSGTIKAKEACPYFRFIVSDEAGYYLLAAGKAFDVNKPILWLTSTLTAGGTTTNTYLAYSSIYVKYHLSTFTGVQSASLYLVGTLSGSQFLPAENYLTCTPPTEEDGLTYMLLGTMTSSYYLMLFPEHPLYRFVNGSFSPLSQVAYEAYAEIGEVRTELQTAIEQTNASIALKADKTTVDNLTKRVSSAEQKITADAIVSTVRSSSAYEADLADKASASEVMAVQEDLAAMQIGGRNLLLSSQAERTIKNSAAMIDISAYGQTLMAAGETDVVISFDAKADTATSVDHYPRTSAGAVVSKAKSTAVTTEWHRYSQVYTFSANTYTQFTIRSNASVTGGGGSSTASVMLRNIKLEVGNKATDWTAAPEEMETRMASAESSITQNAANIALKVSTSTYNTEKVYRSTSAPSSKSTNMLWLDLSLSPPILKRWSGSAWISVGAQEVKTSGINIGPNKVAITTENFLLQLLDPTDNENVLMEMSAEGNVGFKQLYADQVISDSVAQSYAGSSWLYVDPSIETPTDVDFRSLGEAVQVLNNKYLPNDVTIYLPWGYETYEPSGVVIRGISGPGKLRIYGYGDLSILNSYIKVHGCFAHICFQNLYLRESRSLNGSSRQSYLTEITKCHFVEFSGCTLDANSITYDSVYARSSHVFLYNCGLYNALQGLECYLAHGNMKDCRGSCNWSMVAYSSIIIASGTVPSGSRGSGENGQVFASSVTVDYGTASAPVVPDETGLLYATTTKSWRGSWRSDTLDVIQGVYSESGYSSSLNWHRGCMWFGNAQNLLSGCTVKSATLTLHRKTGSGSSAAKSVYLCAISNTSASGTPSIAWNYGAIGTIGRDKQVTFSIPVDAVQGLADGYYGGLCIYETPYDFGSSTYSNAYMRMSGTDTNYEPYIECVYGGSTAVG